MSKSAEKALSLLRHMPRLTLRAAERMPTPGKKRVRQTAIRSKEPSINDVLKVMEYDMCHGSQFLTPCS